MTIYLLNLSPSTVAISVTDQTNGNSQTYTLSPYQYVDISPMISSPSDHILVQVGTNITGLFSVSSGVETIYFAGPYSVLLLEYSSPDQILEEYLYNNILQNMNTDLEEVYQALLSLISEYASGEPLSQSTLSKVSSTLQQINNMLQNAILFENETSTSYEGVSALQQVYSNLVQIYESLTNHTLAVEELQNLQLPSYSTPEASAIASTYTQFLNNAINVMESASSQSNNSSSPPSSSQSSSPSSSSTNTPTSTPSSSTSSSSASSQSSSQNISITSPTSSTSPTTITQGQMLAQIQAGDLSSLQSKISELPPNMIPVVNAVTQLYQIYNIPNGTPLSTVVERLLSDIRDAYYKISNHKQKQVNTQKLSQLLQIYNTLASSGLAPQSQSASKLSNLVKTSGIIPAVPAVLGKSYPGTVYSNYV